MSTVQRHPICVMVGPGIEGQGGISSVVQVYDQADFFTDGSVVMLSTVASGSAWNKLKVVAKSLLAYSSLLLRGRAQVLHVHVASKASFWRKAVFIWMALLAQRRIVFHLHGGGFKLFIEQLPRFQRTIAIATIRRCDQLLCLTSPMQDWLRQLAPDTPVKWWPNPVFNELVAVKVPTELREPIVLYLGVLLPAKGLMDLVDAFAQLHASDPSARLVIGGTGPEQQALDKRVVELNLQDCVVFLGWINVEQKASWLSRARVLALASHLEAQPMVLLEAMASGAVVVSTNVGGIPDLIENNVQGLLVPPHDVNAFSQALQSLWHDVPLRQRLSASAHQLVLKRHKADEACNALRQLYQEMEEQS